MTKDRIESFYRQIEEITDVREEIYMSLHGVGFSTFEDANDWHTCEDETDMKVYVKLLKEIIK